MNAYGKRAYNSCTPFFYTDYVMPFREKRKSTNFEISNIVRYKSRKSLLKKENEQFIIGFQRKTFDIPLYCLN